ncbi:4-nitrophenylphosphatase-like [Venturia canescens]|uniref:4-nitrophenylphosphatase-like n=1 Tax=Venturia canescens TaxID=32260 RepID=UPI001C9C0C2E|nr:4-nitrophenylphosphatase-like [Venturia canescens]
MAKLKNLMESKSDEIQNFLDSFDTIVTDCDGVLWTGKQPIEKSLETIEKLEKLGKKIIFASNNSTLSVEDYCEKFRKFGYPAAPEQIVIPSIVICWYLKNRKFDGKVFVVGTTTFCKVIKNEGVFVAEPCPDRIIEGYEEITEQFQADLDVKAVIIDMDVNVTWLKIIKSIRYLKDRNVLYLAGALDRKIPFGKNKTILGMSPFVDLISEETGREPIECAKPSIIFKSYIIDKYKLDDPSRCLFIGDSFENDMQFADLCGFQKLWVASGIDTLESIQIDGKRSTANDRYSIPHYYLPSLGHLLDRLNN